MPLGKSLTSIVDAVFVSSIVLICLPVLSNKVAFVVTNVCGTVTTTVVRAGTG